MCKYNNITSCQDGRPSFASTGPRVGTTHVCSSPSTLVHGHEPYDRASSLNFLYSWLSTCSNHYVRHCMTSSFGIPLFMIPTSITTFWRPCTTREWGLLSSVLDIMYFKVMSFNAVFKQNFTENIVLSKMFLSKILLNWHAHSQLFLQNCTKLHDGLNTSHCQLCSFRRLCLTHSTQLRGCSARTAWRRPS